MQYIYYFPNKEALFHNIDTFPVEIFGCKRLINLPAYQSLIENLRYVWYISKEIEEVSFTYNDLSGLGG
jgi:hypothetical protein